MPAARRTSPAARRGFTLIEAAVSTIVVGVMLVAAFQTVASAADGRRKAFNLRKAQVLADMLLTEVCSMPYEDPNSPGGFGPESGETAEPRTFNDIDDYDGYTAKPPTDRKGVVIAPYEGWRWSASVQNVLSDLTGVRAASASVGLRLVTVTVTSPEGVTTTQSRLRSRWSVFDQMPTNDSRAFRRVVVRIGAGDSPIDVYQSVDTINSPQEVP